MPGADPVDAGCLETEMGGSRRYVTANRAQDESSAVGPGKHGQLADLGIPGTRRDLGEDGPQPTHQGGRNAGP